MHLKITIDMDCDNTAFMESHGEQTPDSLHAEVSRILERSIQSFWAPIGEPETIVLRDRNGNKVGKAIVAWTED